MLLWHLFEENDGWCVVNEKNVVKAGPININERCKFWYQGKEYEGKLLQSDVSYETLNEELNRLLKQSRSRNKPANKPSKPGEQLPVKRKISATSFYGTGPKPNERVPPSKKTKSAKQPMTEAERTRLRVLELNKNEAMKRSNNQLLDRLTSSKERDPDYQPSDDDASQDSDVGDKTAQGSIMKLNKISILNELKNQGADSDKMSSPHSSPSKEDLKRQIEQLQAQLLRDSYNNASSSAKGKGNRFDQKQDKDKEHDIGKKQDKDKEHDIGEKQDKDKEHDIGKKKDKDNEHISKNKDKDKEHDIDLMDDETLNDLLNERDINEEEDHAKCKGNKKTKKGSATGKDDDSSFDYQDNFEKDKEQKSSERDTSRDHVADDDIPDLDKSIDAVLESQLYGKRNNTIELGRQIYCKSDELTKAMSNATSVNTLVRRLIAGVYIPSKIINCTTTGQSWHAGGSEKSKEEMSPLHQGALRVIVAFANKVALKKKWKQKSFEKMKPIVSNRLVEIKKQVKQGKLLD